jgi:hypothetical protein
MELDPDVRAFYERGAEADRPLGGFPSGPLERTKELIRRHLPPGNVRVLGVGGGPGVYSRWLMDAGHEVQLVDAVPRGTSLHDGGLPLVAEAVRTGVFRGGQEVFTNAYFHLPSELRREVEAAGFAEAHVYNIEGPGFLVHNFEERWADPARREVLLNAARLVESEAEMLAAASHLLAIATRPNRLAATSGHR